jgi:hypothetical protein
MSTTSLVTDTVVVLNTISLQCSHMLRVMRDAHQIKSISPGLHDLLPSMEPPGYKIIIIGYRG